MLTLGITRSRRLKRRNENRMPKSRDATRFRQHIESWPALALTLLQADYKWNAWGREFLAKMALATSKHPTPRQIEMLLELDSRLW
jgi:hypothetical protein